MVSITANVYIKRHLLTVDRWGHVNCHKEHTANAFVGSLLSLISERAKLYKFNGITYGNMDFIILFTPINYTPHNNYFNTSSVETVIAMIVRINTNATIVVKFTVIIGYIPNLSERNIHGKTLFLG